MKAAHKFLIGINGFCYKESRPNLPTLAEAFYKLNDHQAIDLEIGAIKISDFCHNYISPI